MSDDSLKVVLYSDDTVGIMIKDGLCLITPQVAVEIAQSLMMVAKQADPSLDVDGISKTFKETHRPLDATLN